MTGSSAESLTIHNLGQNDTPARHTSYEGPAATSRGLDNSLKQLLESSVPKKLLVDLDGVLVDFVRGAFVHHGRTDLKYRQVHWELEGLFFPNEPRAKFWESLGYDFWSNLPWCPEGRILLEGLKKVVGTNNILFCTSPCDTHGGVEGKVEWLRRNIPDMRRQFMITPQKHFAAKGNVLIDDNDKNCETFEKHGGTTIMVPQPWNKLATWLRGEQYDPTSIIDELIAVWGDK